MRLDKVLASTGFGSRKEVRSLIKKGRVIVNDQIIKDNGAHVDPNSNIIKVDNSMVHYRQFVYIMMNKAPGYVSATEDLHEKTVIDLLPADLIRFKPFPVGRLDKDTEGLLLLTNDGELAHHLTSPKKEVRKTYYAKIHGIITDKDVKKFLHGLKLNDGTITKPAKLNILESDHLSEVEISVTEGKYHQVKRMVAAVGKKVVYLKRIQIGELVLDEKLTPGSFRELMTDELAYCLSLKSK